MANQPNPPKINWYRSPVERGTLAVLNQRSDFLGFMQTLGHLGLLAITGAASWYSAARLSIWVTLLVLFLHGTFYNFLLNAFHEFCHRSVFKTKALNAIFLYIVSFLSWYNPIFFWASHQEHHKYTLHPPADLEVVLPVKLTLKNFLQNALVNPWELYSRVRSTIRLSLGRLEGEWEKALFPPEALAARRRLFTWARIQIIGSIVLVGVSLYLGWWMLPVIITLAPFYGGGLQYLCNNTQHIGLQDNVPDFRLCTRTIILNPFVRFLYWHMNFHIEHHMYAAVPCYHLGKLHKAIQTDLPPCHGLVAAWKEIVWILRKQKEDPTYQFIAELPTQASD